MKRSNSITQITLYAFASLIMLLFMAPLALAQEGTGVQLYLQPVESPEGTLIVDIIAENVSNLYGAEFKLSYDPAMLSVQDDNTNQEDIQIKAGDLLPVNKGFVVANKVDEAEGTITFAMTLLNPAPPVEGNGSLGRVTFDVLQIGPSNINVEHSKLVARDLQTISSEMSSLAVTNDGFVQVNNRDLQDANEPTGFPWWIVAAIILVLGTAILSGIILKKNRKPQPQKVVAATPKPKVQSPQVAQKRPRSRPSAFKNPSLDDQRVQQLPKK